MLELKNIKKDYPTGGEVVHALKGVSLSFRKSEFVSILGQSGCGKTTMLNIIGGLDKYTDGDLVINGRSTKDFKDRDWDAYRNHSIGFVFQSYNLIPHQSVIQNVELALALSGYSKAERRAKAKRALELVGLGDQLKKRPGEMSGGQMQRVAIARALVNDPDIILADEPTGALDTETSLQVMEILKEISKERLVIMVTHNPELAEKYSTRIVRMLDGLITQDSDPLTDEELLAASAESATVATPSDKKKKREKKPTLSPVTSFFLSLKNLFTKKGRTILTSFAGSIGIIGIALILSVSEGMSLYIDSVQESTLSAYPMTFKAQTLNLSSLMTTLMSGGSGIEHDTDAVYKDPVIADLVNALSEIESNTNDLKAFKTYIESEMEKEGSDLQKAVNGIQYTYDFTPAIYTKNTNGDIIKSDVNELMMSMMGDFLIKAGLAGSDSLSGMTGSTSSLSNPMFGKMGGTDIWQELLPGLDDGDPINDMIRDQYEMVYGSWPNSKDEIVLVLNSKNELDDLTLYSLGLLSREEIDAIIDAAASGQTLPTDNKSWSYEEICQKRFRLILPYDFYTEGENGVFVDRSDDENMLKLLYNDALELRVTGIIRPNPDSDVAMLSGAVGYTHMLTEYVIEQAADSPVVKAQLEDPTVDVLTGLPFKSSTGSLSPEEKETEFREYVGKLMATSPEKSAAAYITIQCIIEEQASLDTNVEMTLSYLRSMGKDAIIAMVSSKFAEQMDMSVEQLTEMLAGVSEDELIEMIRPGIVESERAKLAAAVAARFADKNSQQLVMNLNSAMKNYTTEECAAYYDRVLEFSSSTYEDNLVLIGSLDLESPASINLYASSFENKDLIVAAVDSYNASVGEAQRIEYTDILGIMMSSITTIINAISYVLIAFVSVSLIVSSIMIGVITLISVQERTKEIGILRALGASKRNVSGMFNAETLIIGFTSGALGVVVTYLLIIPINIILNKVTGINSLDAVLPFEAALILIAISMALTLFSGIIPSRSAAKKDPVVALRTE